MIVHVHGVLPERPQSKVHGPDSDIDGESTSSIYFLIRISWSMRQLRLRKACSHIRETPHWTDESKSILMSDHDHERASTRQPT